ncbi:ABC transporter permease [Gryllotalpicola protaetiae]|uniref:ABC transporter permease n=1 Tax=Gryllotalpicola protaetiae TaxID=2419771 RepID=A0A387BJ78_9MICO|nr:ABC transporter permease [Gryllotalpicola protaetiae]AYG02214.1 ABC transporter permease [Gryllotalpicola protaetiae]
MIQFAAKRLGLAAVVIIGVSAVVFLTMKIIPGNPVAALLGPNSTPGQREALTERLGLDQPIYVQYADWARAAAHGDLGASISLHQGAAGLVLAAFLNTLILIGAALVLAACGGFVLGTIAALRPGTRTGRLVNGAALTALSLPQYTVALVLLWFAVQTRLLPSGGMVSTGGSGAATVLQHLVLPALAASLAPMGGIARMFSTALQEVLGQPFVTSYRARGLRRAAVVRHAIRNTIPALLGITGLQVSYLLGGAVFIEVIFAWPGLGQLLFNAIAARDYPLVQAGVLVSAVLLVLVNAAVDTAHAGLDPRVRT